MSKSSAPPRWKAEIGRTIAIAAGGVIIGLLGWSTATAGAIGAVAGVIVALGVEWILRLRAEVVRLQGIERERDSEREQAARLKQHMEFQLQVAQRESAIHAVHMKVYSDAFMEVGGVQRIPPEAILARIEVSTKAANLDIPLTPPPEA